MPITLKEEVKLIERNADLVNENSTLRAWREAAEERAALRDKLDTIKATLNVPADFDPYNESLPFETRHKILSRLDAVLVKEESERAAAERQKARDEEHQQFLQNEEAKREAERARIAQNVRDCGHIRVGTVAAFNELSDANKKTLLHAFGPGIVEQIRQKEASGLDWPAFDELCNIKGEPAKSKSSKKPASKETKRELQPEDEDYDDSNGRYFFYREHLRATGQLKKSSSS